MQSAYDVNLDLCLYKKFYQSMTRYTIIKYYKISWKPLGVNIKVLISLIFASYCLALISWNVTSGVPELR